MRLLHVTPFYAPAWRFGGMARASTALCHALADRGHEVVVVTAKLSPDDPESETRAGVSVLRFEVSDWLARRLVPWSPRVGGWIRERASSFGLAHLHGHRNGFSVSAARACRGRGLPYVLQPHGTSPSHGQHVVLKSVFDRLWGSATLRGAAAIIAVSEAERRQLGARARLVANGVEPVAEPRSVTREPDLLLFVGSDRPQKRGFLLTSILESMPDVRLELVGRFDQRFRARFAPWAERVRFAGVMVGPELAEAYSRARLLVHPAVGEAFGMVPFEAAFHGTASIVAGDHGCGEWFAHAGGCTVPADRPEQLVASIRERLADPARADGESRAVATFTRTRLSWPASARDMEALYREIGSMRSAA